jgi:hypothetical protein
MIITVILCSVSFFVGVLFGMVMLGILSNSRIEEDETEV